MFATELEQFTKILIHLFPQIEASEIADILWLADFIENVEKEQPSKLDPTRDEIFNTQNDNKSDYKSSAIQAKNDSRSIKSHKNTQEIYSKAHNSSLKLDQGAQPVKIPIGGTLAHKLEIARALRPLNKKIPSRTNVDININKTIQLITENNGKLGHLIQEPIDDEWLDLIFVIDSSPSMKIWKKTINEFEHLLRHQIKFRHSYIWNLQLSEKTKNLEFYAGKDLYRKASPNAIIDSNRQRLILIISDCVAPFWQDGQILDFIEKWANHHIVSIIQMLPQHLWKKTGLRHGIPVYLWAKYFDQITANFQKKRRNQINSSSLELPENSINIPVTTLEPSQLSAWAKAISGIPEAFSQGYIFSKELIKTKNIHESRKFSLTPEKRVLNFQKTASPLAQELASLLASTVLSLPIIYLIQNAMLPKSNQTHLAEFILSGLVKLKTSDEDSWATIHFEFHEGVREILLEQSLISDSLNVIQTISEYIQRNLGSNNDFIAFLKNPTQNNNYLISEDVKSFMMITDHILSRLGGQFSNLPSMGEFLDREPTEFINHDNLVENWESRLMVVGDGGMGKTSLISRLMNDIFDPSTVLTTSGIDINSLKLPHPIRDDIEMRLNVWDFAGQAIYHATHQFFYSGRSLFLLVWNARIGYEQGNIFYWLDQIKALAPDSPILIVATHTDQRNPHLPLIEIRRRYPQIVDFFAVSNVTGENIRDLRESIRQNSANLPLMGQPWNKTWNQVVTAIRQDIRIYMSAHELFEIMSSYAVKSEDQNILAIYLHELGYILFFHDIPELSDIVVLNPVWMIGYISDALGNKNVINNLGIFTREDMNSIWADIDPYLREYLLRLMEQFDLSYPIPDDMSNRSLIVGAMQIQEADYHEQWESLHTEKQLSIKFRMPKSHILPGIPTWFIARSYRFTTHTHWKTGALLADKNSQNYALLRTYPEQRYLELLVRGKNPSNFFALLRDGIDVTLDRYPGLKVIRTIPCPCGGNENKGCSYEFNVRTVEKALEQDPPISSLKCQETLKDVELYPLTTGILGKQILNNKIDTTIMHGVKIEPVISISANRPKSVKDIFILRSQNDGILRDVVLPTIEKTGLSYSIYAEDVFSAMNKLKAFWTQLWYAKAVIADFTDKNPLVFYGMGIANTLGIPFILLAQRKDDIPFDLRDFSEFQYSTESTMETYYTSRFEEVFQSLQQHIQDWQTPSLENGIAYVNPLWGKPQNDIQYHCDVFMALPFRQQLLDIYDQFIHPLVTNEIGKLILKGDDFFNVNNTIMGAVWSSIYASDYIIAECTGRNPNVFYELGMAHVCGRKVVLITQQSADIPEILRTYRYILYGSDFDGINDLTTALSSAIT